MSDRSESTWTVREAKSRLSEVLRCARKNGPQFIGTRDPCVVVSREEWEAHAKPKERLSSWLLNHSPGVDGLETPPRGASDSRSLPFSEGDSG